jgi:hypothetical protein
VPETVLPSDEENPLTVIRSGSPQPLAALGLVLLSLISAVVLSACSSNTNRSITAQVGVDTGVALTTAGSVTSIYEAATLAMAADVENPSNDTGVNWTVTGVGSLSTVTNSSATYVAPGTVTGAATALITATSNANPSQYATVTIVVYGSPVNNTPSLFPANVNVPYVGEVTVAGGQSPFTWTLVSGTLPPGLILNGSSSGVDTFSGTPTAQGTYNFVLQASDGLGRQTQVAVSLVVNPEAACLLSGHYLFRFSGFRGGGPATHSGSIAIDATTGNITGIQDYKDGHRTTSGETLTSGECTNRAGNSGSVKLTAPSGTIVYNFSATPPDSSGAIHSAPMVLISSGSDSGSGVLTLQDPNALSTTPPAGNFAFGVLGVDGANHFGTVGRFTTNSAGTLSAGLVDSNDPANLLTADALTGTLSAPDANGRGTATLTAGTVTSTLAYYIINASKLYLMDIDSTTGSIEIGQMTAQVGDAGAETFDNNAMASPSIFSIFGASGSVEPVTQMALGRLYNANPDAGTLGALIDATYNATDIPSLLNVTQTYTVDSSGRGTLNLTEYTGPVSFAFYLDGTADGYLVQQGSTAGGAGFLEAQFQGPFASPPASGVFPDTLANEFVDVTAYPQSHGPVSLESAIVLNYGSLTSNFTNGTFSIDPTTGRGVGTLTTSAVGSAPAALYIVSPTKIDVLNFGTRALDGSIDFLTQN